MQRLLPRTHAAWAGGVMAKKTPLTPEQRLSRIPSIVNGIGGSLERAVRELDDLKTTIEELVPDEVVRIKAATVSARKAAVTLEAIWDRLTVDDDDVVAS